MYSSYSPLQRRQLREQTYTDTQSTYLLVYAPGRRNALTLSLAEQLHRKFRLVDRLEGELTPSVNGVLLVSEDVECTSTALTYFAAALQQGADLVVCDAVFGYDGGSALYQTDQHLPGQRCALLSRALLDRCRAAARGKDDVLELLRLANRDPAAGPWPPRATRTQPTLRGSARRRSQGQRSGTHGAKNRSRSRRTAGAEAEHPARCRHPARPARPHISAPAAPAPGTAVPGGKRLRPTAGAAVPVRPRGCLPRPGSGGHRCS